MPNDSFPVQDLSVDALFMANSCEVQNGLLYVMGGGWMRCWPEDGVAYPYDRRLGVVLLIRVPYSRTDREHTFVVSVGDSDEREIGKAEGKFRLGWDVDLTEGMSQLVPVAMQAPVKLDAPGIYHVSASLNGVERHRIEFEALEKRPGA